MKKKPSALEKLQKRFDKLQERNRELEDTVNAIQSGEVDALVIQGPAGERIFTLNGAEQPYRELVESMNEGAATISGAGIVLYCNSKFAKMTGRPLEQVIGADASTLFTEGEKAKFKALLRHGKNGAATREIKMGSPLKTSLAAQFSVNRVRIENAMGFCVVATDLVDRREAEERLLAANESLELRVGARTRDLTRALEAREEFLSIASHELKTPLTALSLQLQITQARIRRSLGVPIKTELLESAMDMSLKQVSALTNLVNDLLDVTRTRSGHLALEISEVVADRLVEDVVERLATSLAAAKCTVKLDLASGIKGQWDRGRVEQIIVNLLANAMKYAPRGPVYISLHADEKSACFRFRDSGPGIPHDKRESIFERFDRAGVSQSVAGLGLGLFIVRQIATAHRGSVAVDDKGEPGATFVLKLPLALASP